MMNEKEEGYSARKTIIKSIIIGLVSFIAAQVLFGFVMYSSTLVPQEAIRANMEKSADRICENPPFYVMMRDLMPTMIDGYADAITLNIAWNLGGEDHLRDSLMCEFLTSDSINQTFNFGSAVKGDIDESHYITQYLRYWHGSSALMRFMHLFMSVKEVYITNGIIIAILTVLNILVFIRKKIYDCAIAFLVGLIASNTLFVPLCLEYTWVYIVMLTVNLLVSLVLTSGGETKDIRKKTSLCIYIIFLGAMTVNFLDFLTAETLTLTVPLLIMSRIVREKKVYILPLAGTISWGAGYAGTWVSKWIISSIVLKENVLPYITEHISERLGGEVYGDPVSQAGQIFGAIGRNIINLFPIGYGAPGIAGFIVIAIFLSYYVFVYWKKGADPGKIIVYAAIGLIPYIRYIVLHNHSYIHRFFTCRAQMATVMAVLLTVFEVTEIKGAHKNIKIGSQKSRKARK